MPLRLTLGLATAAVIAMVTAACGGSTAITEVAGPDGVRCQTGVSAPPSTIPAGGNRVTLTVLAARECTWTASSEASWLQVTPTTGQGESSITVTVAANPDAQVRTGAIVVNGNRLSLRQDAAPCRFDLSPGIVRLSHDAERVSIQISTSNGCAWRAASNQPWARLVTDSGTSGGTVEIDVSRNDGPARTATIAVADRAATIQQGEAGAPNSPTPPTPGPSTPNPNPGSPSCTGAIEPDARSFGASADEGTIVLMLLPTCSWNASANADWISLLATSGTGPGPLRYRVGANTSTSERTGTVTVAGRTHTVRQAGTAPPPQATSREVDFKGTATNVTGSCPGISFSAGGYSVFTDGETKWKGDGCRDLRHGVDVKVRGVLLADRRVRATRVDVD